MPFLFASTLSKENVAGMRSVDFDVTCRAVSVLRSQVVVRSTGLLSTHAVVLTVTFET